MAAALPKVMRRSSEARWLSSLDELVREEKLADRKNVGGKAARLAWLKRHGFLVPETWVLPQKAFAAAVRQLSPACEPRSLLRAASGRAEDHPGDEGCAWRSDRRRAGASRGRCLGQALHEERADPEQGNLPHQP